MEAAFAACRQIFGVAAVARAVPCEKTVEAIKGAGLKPGIWFEIENAGPA